MLDKSSSAGDNSNVVSTKGDGNVTTIVNNNIDVKMVEVIVKGILHDSLPAFQQEAREKAQLSIQDYVDSLVREMILQGTTEDTIQQKLPSPDIQYSIYETAKSYAKSPSRADKKTLINLVVQKINTHDEDVDDLITLDLAIESSSKMSLNQIKFLAFLTYINGIVKFGKSLDGVDIPMDPSNPKGFREDDDNYIFSGSLVKSKREVNDLYLHLYNQELVQVFPEGDLREVNTGIALALGCVTRNPMQKLDVNAIIKKRTGLDLTDQHHAMKLKLLTDRIDAVGGMDNVSSNLITDIGFKIGLAYISTRLKLVNY